MTLQQKKRRTKIMTQNNPAHIVIAELVRFSYVHLIEPYTENPEKNEPKYSAMLLIPKDHIDTINKIQQAQKFVFDRDGAKVLPGFKFEQIKKILRDGDDPIATGGIMKPEALRGNYFLNASNKRQPQIVGTQRDAQGNLKPLDLNEEEIYSGMYGRVGLTFFCYNTQNNRGVSAALENVQKVKDGERLSGGPVDANTDFAEFEDEADDNLFTEMGSQNNTDIMG